MNTQKSFNNYPQSATNNARRALKYRDENGSDCGTRVGWERANQLASREAISLDTVKRTFSFLSRAETYYTEGGSLEECGNIMYLAWGGLSMKRWCESILDENENKSYTENMKQKAKPEDLNIGDKVSWSSSGGTARGVIKERIQGEYNVPDTDVTLQGSEEDPVFAIEIVQEVEGGSYELAGQMVGHKAGALTKVSFELKKSLSYEVELYKKGVSKNAPIIQKDVKMTIEGTKVIMSLEEVDRDGEIVELDGMQLPADKSVPLIDSHRMNDTIRNTAGVVENIRVQEEDGKKALVGDIRFAPTDLGEEAEILYRGRDGEKPYLKAVSIGFAVYDYDNETKRIPDSELYELSLIHVGSNRGARVVGSKAVKQEKQLVKDLARYAEIKDAFKEFCKLYLSNSFTKKIGYEKDGDLLIDVIGVHDRLIQLIESKTAEEAPQKKVEAPQTVSMDEITKLIQERISKKLGS